MRIRNDIFAAGLIVIMMAGAVGFVGYGVYEKQLNAENTYIMIRKDSLERLIRQPCMANTLEYMGNYILCRRRADYEPHEQEKNAVLYPSQSEDRIPGDHKEKS